MTVSFQFDKMIFQTRFGSMYAVEYPREAMPETFLGFVLLVEVVPTQNRQRARVYYSDLVQAPNEFYRSLADFDRIRVTRMIQAIFRSILIFKPIVKATNNMLLDYSGGVVPVDGVIVSSLNWSPKRLSWYRKPIETKDIYIVFRDHIPHICIDELKGVFSPIQNYAPRGRFKYSGMYEVLIDSDADGTLRLHIIRDRYDKPIKGLLKSLDVTHSRSGVEVGVFQLGTITINMGLSRAGWIEKLHLDGNNIGNCGKVRHRELSSEKKKKTRWRQFSSINMTSYYNNIYTRMMVNSKQMYIKPDEKCQVLRIGKDNDVCAFIVINYRLFYQKLVKILETSQVHPFFDFMEEKGVIVEVYRDPDDGTIKDAVFIPVTEL